MSADLSPAGRRHQVVTCLAGHGIRVTGEGGEDSPVVLPLDEAEKFGEALAEYADRAALNRQEADDMHHLLGFLAARPWVTVADALAEAGKAAEAGKELEWRPARVARDLGELIAERQAATVGTGPAELAERVRLLARAADTLGASIRDALAELRAAGEPVSLASFQLTDAPGSAASLRRQLLATAGDLDYLAARPADACEAVWGCCPEHGATLVSSGGETRCQVTGCGRRWAYDRIGLPCGEPAVRQVTLRGDKSLRLCKGHGRDADERLEGAVLEPLTPRARNECP